MATSSKIVDLRHLLAERFPRPLLTPTASLPTGLAQFDQATQGGLPKGAITELISPRFSAGSALFIHALLRAAWRDRYFLALIDGRDSFDPEPFSDSQLRHLLWIRCRQPSEAIKAADLLLRDGNFPLVILDLVLNCPEELRKIPASHWYRLQRLVEPSPVAFLIVTRRSMVSSARLKVLLDNLWTLEDLENAQAIARLKVRVQRRQGRGQAARAAS